MASNLNCYSGKVTNDKNNELRVTALGFDKTASGKINIYSTIIPLRDVLPAMPRELSMGRKRDKNNIFISNGAFLGQTLGNVTINEKTASITVADDLIFDLGEPLGAPTKNILKNMLTGEIFKKSSSDVDGVKPLGVFGSAMYTGGTCPTMVLGQDWKYLFTKEAELKIPYGEGATRNNSFLESASATQIPIMLEYKTTYGDGTVKVVRYTGVCGANIMDNSADDLNKFSVDLDFYCDGKEYSAYFIDGGFTADADSATSLYKFKAPTGKNLYVWENATGDAPTDFGVSGDIAVCVDTATGATTIKKSSGSAWADITGTCKAGTVIFGTKAGTTGAISTATTSYKYIAFKAGATAGSGAGGTVATTITSQASTGFTLGTTYSFDIKDFDFTTQAFVAYVG